MKIGKYLMKPVTMRPILFTLFTLMGSTLLPTAHACSPGLANYGNCVRQQQEMQRQINYQYHQQQQQQNYGGVYRKPEPTVIKVYDILVLSWTKNDGQASWYHREYKTPHDVSHYIYDETIQMALDECNADASARPCKHATLAVGNECIAYLDTPKIQYSDNGNTCQQAEAKIMQRCLSHYKGDRKICSGIQHKRPADAGF